jgi:hypothetical protein
MNRVLRIDLDYDLEGLKKSAGANSPVIPPSQEITRNIIENTYSQNHAKMGVKLARVWRRIVKTIEKAMDEGRTLVVLRDDDFKSLVGEVEKCEYDNRQAFIVPVLLDELDRIAALSDEESAAALKKLDTILLNAKANAEASHQVDKVMEMSRAKTG